ncbi:MAG: DNA repair protein RecN [Deltaproteobacteria bacterium]|nr:DNA repair protein RecN [Deltaproteobacteria bacterium]
MIRELAIKNFAIIEDLRISFKEGLTVLSGETGAGKSIIINAVNLLLGKRASADMIRTGSDTAELEAAFLIPTQSVAAKIMKEFGFDPSEGLIVRRIISDNNRHKIYINGRLATVQQLTSITENLTSISGQHAHQGLLNEDQHLLILDQFGGLISLRGKIAKNYHTLVPLIKKLKELNDVKDRQDNQLALLEFQKQEIENADLAPNEDKELELERTRLKNSEHIFRSVSQCVELLYDAPGAVAEKLSEVRKTIEKTSSIDPGLLHLCEDAGDAYARIEDITGGLRSYLVTIQMDEARLDTIEERMDQIQKLKKKYRGSLEAISFYLETIKKQLGGLENLEEEISTTATALQACYDTMIILAKDLSKKRKQAALKFSKKVEKELADLKMPGTEFKVKVHPVHAGKNTNPYLSIDEMALDETGFDRAVLLIAPNVGEDMKPLATIASGGELSRVVLALKAIIAKTDSLETVVFDEVDAGIGGGTAEVVGKKLSALSKYHQIICITHLAQIAKFGSNHFKISKSILGGRTRTEIEPLDKKERVKELARMMGGEKITTATMDHARELLNK